METNPDKIKALYDAASQKFDNLGTYEEFSQKLQDPAKRKTFYDAASNVFDNLGDYASFESKVVKKKAKQTLRQRIKASLAKVRKSLHT